MRFKLDENLPVELAEVFCEAGHVVVKQLAGQGSYVTKFAIGTTAAYITRKG